MSGSRLASGGCVDRTRPLRFTFDGRAYTGHAGDTLASALLANGVSVVERDIDCGDHGEFYRLVHAELRDGVFYFDCF